MKREASQQGAAMVEFAIVLPVLLMLIFGMIEFSLLLYNKAVITNASREGARAGVVYGMPSLNDEEIEQVVLDYCQDFLITFGDAVAPVPVVSNGPCGDGAAGNPLTVTVTYNYSFLVIPNFVTSLGEGINLSAQTVMRCE